MAKRDETLATDAAPAPAEPAPPTEPPPSPAPARTDEIVDRWLGDYAIPNHFRTAVDELKRRLRAG